MSDASQTPTQIGSLTEEELSEFSQVRNLASQMIQQLGSLELRKSRLIADLEANEQKAQTLLASARERVGLTDDTLGKFVMMALSTLFRLPLKVRAWRAEKEYGVLWLQDGIRIEVLTLSPTFHECHFTLPQE